MPANDWEAQARNDGFSDAAIAEVKRRLGMTAAPTAATAAPTAPPAAAPSFDTRVGEMQAGIQQDAASSPLQALKMYPAAFMASAADAGTLGYSSKLAGMASGEGGDAGLAATEAMRREYPITSTAGAVTGAIMSPVTGGLAKGGAALAERAAGLVPQTAKGLAEAGIFARSALAGIKNLIGGGAAITGAELAGAKPSGTALSQRLSSAYNAATSPENVLISVGLGAWQGSLAAKSQASAEARAVAGLAAKYERLTGKPLHSSVLTDNQAQHDFIDAAAQIPELASDVRRLRDETMRGFVALGDDIAARYAGKARAAAPTTSDAAAALRTMKGEPVPGSLAKPGKGVITAARQAPEAAAMAAESGNTLTREQQSGFFRAWDAIQSRRKAAESAPALDALKNRLSRVFVNAPKGKAPPLMDVSELEALRKELSNRAFSFNMADPSAKGWTSQARREARDLYTVVDGLIGETGPQFQRSMKVAAGLRRMEEAVADVPTSEVDQRLVERFWSSDNVATAWRGVVEHGAPDIVNRLRGQYVYDLVDRVIDPKTGIATKARLDKTLGSGGRFGSQVAEMVAPGITDELRAHVQLSEIARRGVLSDRNSRTAGRGAFFAKDVVRATQAASVLLGLFSNPFSGVAGAVGVEGVKQALMAMRRSQISGYGEQAMQAAIKGLGPQAAALPQLVASQMGGASRLPAIGQSAVQGAADVAMPVVNRFSQSLTTPPQGAQER